MSEGSRRQLSPSSLYLLFYNSLQAFGWFVALYRLVSSFAETQTLVQAYSSTGNLICNQIFTVCMWLHQNLSILADIPQVHCLLIGVGSGEMLLMYRTLPYIKAQNLYRRTFNKLHVSYHSFVVTVLAMYPLLWLQLYTHMFHQQRSKLKNLSSKKY